MTSIERRPVGPPAALEPATATVTVTATVTAPATAAAPPAYVGLVTRALAFALDAAIINAVALLVTAVISLTLSVVKVPESWKAELIALGGAVYLLWTVAYFVAFWSATGQTPGDRVLRIRVTQADGGRLGPARALVRFGALLLAALPLFAGFALILFDGRRRGLHDRIARTVVVDAPRRARG
jgi:uncharacterized RDD family membrane protein YckC